jgi:hypothetical protein
VANATQVWHRHPRAGERWLKVYTDGAWAGLAASMVLATTFVMAHEWGSYDSANVLNRAVVYGLVGLALGPIFSLLTRRWHVRSLVPVAVIFALAIGVILGQTTAATVVPVTLYGATLGLTLRYLRRVAAKRY